MTGQTDVCVHISDHLAYIYPVLPRDVSERLLYVVLVLMCHSKVWGDEKGHGQNQTHKKKQNQWNSKEIVEGSDLPKPLVSNVVYRLQIESILGWRLDKENCYHHLSTTIYSRK